MKFTACFVKIFLPLTEGIAAAKQIPAGKEMHVEDFVKFRQVFAIINGSNMKHCWQLLQILMED